MAWAKAKFQALGYDKVWTEPVTFLKWERRRIPRACSGAHAQALHVTALGGSPGGKVEAEVVRFPTLEALQQAAPGSLTGKIAFIDYRMERKRDGSGYGPGSRVRSGGPSAAIRAGAIGYLMRSAGTDSHRNPHTGITRFDEGWHRSRRRHYPRRMPTSCTAGGARPDLVALARLRLERHVHLAERDRRDHRAQPARRSGGDRRAPDSWDLGTGAIDDGAGVAITMAAGHLVGRLPKAQRPARTLRVVAFANEGWGGRAYAEAHAADLRKHQIGAERLRRRTHLCLRRQGARACGRRGRAHRRAALAPLGIAHVADGEGCGRPVAVQCGGHGLRGLAQDGTDYFDLHHTPDDTSTKVDLQALAQNVAATPCSPTSPRMRKAISAARRRRRTSEPLTAAWRTPRTDLRDKAIGAAALLGATAAPPGQQHRGGGGHVEAFHRAGAGDRQPQVAGGGQRRRHALALRAHDVDQARGQPRERAGPRRRAPPSPPGEAGP